MSKGKKKLIFTTIAVFLCMAAAFGGYKGARYIADRITVKAEINAEKAGLFRPQVRTNEADVTEAGDPEDTGDTALKILSKGRVLSLVYVTDYETGKIDRLALEVFDTINMSASIIYLDPEISYTMTASLYRKLANGNVLLPQTVKLSELYGYYGVENAYEAGKDILSELIGLEIDHYISFSKEYVLEDFLEERMTALGLKELHEQREDRLTSIASEEEAVMITYMENFSDRDVKVYDAPVIKRNESCFADLPGLWSLLKDNVHIE